MLPSLSFSLFERELQEYQESYFMEEPSIKA